MKRARQEKYPAPQTEKNTEKVLRSALSQADGVQARIDAGELDHPLAGVPAAVKR